MTPSPEFGTSPVQMHLSEVLADCIEDDEAQGGNADARAILKLIVQFIIDTQDGPTMDALDANMTARIDKMLPDIPDRPNIPRKHTATLASRYRYAQEKRLVGSEATDRGPAGNGYHNTLSRFFRLGYRARSISLPETDLSADQ
jgi:hypothetical protein